MVSEGERSTWPYALGLFGGLVLGLAAWLLVVVVLGKTRSEAHAQPAIWGVAAGGALLGVAWIGIFQQKQCGFGVIAGSFAVPAAIGYLYLNRDSWGLFGAHTMILLVGLTGCAMAHVFARGMRVTRLLAAAASLGFLVVIITEKQRVDLSSETRTLLTLLSVGGLGTMGLAVAFEVLGLYRAPASEH